MIKNFKTKKLEAFARGNTSKIKQQHHKKVRGILTALDTATCLDDVDLPGGNLHSFKEKNPVVWSLNVSGNYRITFSFEGEDVIDVCYLDTH